MSKGILVAGGAGYIGSHTFVEIINAGYDAVIVDNFSNAEFSVIHRLSKLIGKKVKYYKGDCTNLPFMRKVFKAERNLAGVVHFAAYKAVGESVQKPLKYYRNNIDSLLVSLEVMKEYGVSNLVFSSSCTVYGESERLPVTELTPQKPAISPYGHTKQICEEVIKNTVKSKAGLKAIALRYFNPIGAHPSALIGELPLGVPSNLVPFVTQTAAGIRKQLTVFGKDYPTPDGTCIRDYIHVVDLAKAHVKSLESLMKNKNKDLFDVINVGTGKGNSVMEVIKTFEQIIGLKVNYSIGNRRPGDVAKIYASVDKAKKVLGWRSQLTLKDALVDAWRWQNTLNKRKK